MRAKTDGERTEMARHAELRIEHDLPVLLLRPPKPLAARRPARTTRGPLRQYFPEGTDLSLRGPGEIEAVVVALNGRPRKTLGWCTPAEALDELLTAAHGAHVATTS